MATSDREARYVKAMEGLEVWVGFRDEAGDDDSALGTIDRDDLRTLARAAMKAADAESAEIRAKVKAEALREAADVFECARDDDDYAAFQGWLRDRAIEIEARE